MLPTAPKDQGQLSDDHKHEVLAELAGILKSESFRGSRKCCRFLDHSVRYTLEGKARQELRERIIAVEVFDRAPTYDASEDAIVRVTANEVRKRLALYYSEAKPEKGPVISLPPGSYAATFTWKPATTEAVQPPPVRRLRTWSGKRLAWAILVPVALSMAAVVYVWIVRRNSVEVDVWSPVLRDSRPVLFCVAQPLAYTLVGQLAADPAVWAHAKATPAEVRDLPGQLIPMPDSFVGVGDAHALADIVSFLAQHGKSWHLNAGDATPSADLRNGPVVLIGAYENPWTRRLTEGLPFVFQIGSVIRDQTKAGREWRLTNLTPDWHTPEDYAVVSRFFSPETSQPVMVAAGLSNCGTQAAGEFLTSQNLLSDALRDAPRDWRRKNFQFVLQTKILGKTPGTPTVIAKHFW